MYGQGNKPCFGLRDRKTGKKLETNNDKEIKEQNKINLGQLQDTDIHHMLVCILLILFQNRFIEESTNLEKNAHEFLLLQVF